MPLGRKGRAWVLKKSDLGELRGAMCHWSEEFLLLGQEESQVQKNLMETRLQVQLHHKKNVAALGTTRFFFFKSAGITRLASVPFLSRKKERPQGLLVPILIRD